MQNGRSTDGMGAQLLPRPPWEAISVGNGAGLRATAPFAATSFRGDDPPGASDVRLLSLEHVVGDIVDVEIIGLEGMDGDNCVVDVIIID